MAWIKMDGCIACRKEGNYRQADAHHILDTGRRIDHAHTIPLCEWHHKADNLFSDAHDADAMLSMVGPTLAKHEAEFVARYGTELELLKETDDRYQQDQIAV